MNPTAPPEAPSATIIADADARQKLEHETRGAVEGGGSLPKLEFTGPARAYTGDALSQEAVRALLDFPDLATKVTPENPAGPEDFRCAWICSAPHCRGPRPFRPRALQRASGNEGNVLKTGLPWREPIAVVIDEEEDYASFVGYVLHLQGYRVLICSTEEELDAAGLLIHDEIAAGRRQIEWEMEAAKAALAEVVPTLSKEGGQHAARVMACALAAADTAKDCERYVYALLAQDVTLQMGDRADHSWIVNLVARERRFPQLYRRDHDVAPRITLFSTNPPGRPTQTARKSWLEREIEEVRRDFSRDKPTVPASVPEEDPRVARTREANRAYRDGLGPDAVLEKPLGGVYAVADSIRRAMINRPTIVEKCMLDAQVQRLQSLVGPPLDETLQEHVDGLRAIVDRVYRLWSLPEAARRATAEADAGEWWSHSAPVEAQARALSLLARARWLRENGQTPCDWLRGALLAVQAADILRDKTATLALEALALQHQFEALTECRFFGISYDIQVAARLKAIRARVQHIGRSYRNPVRGEAEAEGNLVNDLILIYRNEGQFEAEAECMIALREARCRVRDGVLLRAVLRYFNKLVSRTSVLARCILYNVLISWFLFYVCILDKCVDGWFDRVARAFFMAFFCFFTVQSPPMPDGWQDYGFSCLNLVQLATIASGYLHLGFLISVIYAKFYRR